MFTRNNTPSGHGDSFSRSAKTKRINRRFQKRISEIRHCMRLWESGPGKVLNDRANTLDADSYKSVSRMMRFVSRRTRRLRFPTWSDRTPVNTISGTLMSLPVTTLNRRCSTERANRFRVTFFDRPAEQGPSLYLQDTSENLTAGEYRECLVWATFFL